MTKKIGRNDPCPCGSGRKYKNCCMQRDKSQPGEESMLSNKDIRPQSLPSVEWYPPAREAQADILQILRSAGKPDEFTDEDVEALNRAVDRLAQAERGAYNLLRERRELAPGCDLKQFLSIEDLRQLLKSLPTLVRSELDRCVSQWQVVIWPEASSEERAAARTKISDEDMRRFLRALAERRIDVMKFEECGGTVESYIPSSVFEEREWSDAMKLATPEGLERQSSALALRKWVQNMSLEEMRAFVQSSREKMDEEEIDKHLQGYRDDMSEQGLRGFLLDFVVEFERLTAADRERSGGVKRLGYLTLQEVKDMSAEELSQLARANIELDSPLMRRRRFLRCVIVQEGKTAAAEELQFVASEIKDLSPEQKRERFLELFMERAPNFRGVTDKELLILAQNPLYHDLLNELKVVPLDRMSEMLYKLYWGLLVLIKHGVSLEQKEDEGTIFGRRI